MTFKTTIIAAGALMAASAATIPTAQAGNVNFGLYFGTPNASVYFGPGYRHQRGPRWHRQALSPSEVRRVLRGYGYRQIRFLDRRAPVYVVRAVAYNGRAYTVRVSAYNGRVIAQYAVDGRRNSRGHRGGWRY